MAQFLVVPQWQGSPAARAMLLADGAHAIAGDLPRAHTTVIDVPTGAGDSLGSGVHRLSVLTQVREAIAEQWRSGTIVIGGDCGIAPAALSSVDGDLSDLAVVWCDAQPDLHTPETSVSGAFSGMALGAVLGAGDHRLTLSPGIPAANAVLVGARSVDAAEEAATASVASLAATDLQDPEALATTVADTGARRAWVHIDLDVLDPAEITGVSSPVPFGVGLAELVASIRSLRERMPLAGASVCGFAPANPEAVSEDMGTILRIIGALA